MYDRIAREILYNRDHTARPFYFSDSDRLLAKCFDLDEQLLEKLTPPDTFIDEAYLQSLVSKKAARNHAQVNQLRKRVRDINIEETGPSPKRAASAGSSVGDPVASTSRRHVVQTDVTMTSDLNVDALRIECYREGLAAFRSMRAYFEMQIESANVVRID